MSKVISFSPPDITEAEIAEVTACLRSGWITTGPRTKELERKLTEFTQADGLACVASATAALECGLRLLGVGHGDEIVVPAYTYTATAAAAYHVGARVVMVDVNPETWGFDLDALRSALTEHTKAVIPVDLGGMPADYEGLRTVLKEASDLWHPESEIQQYFTTIPLFADGAHALGAQYNGAPVGSVADLTAFSFHAVKNFTTGEGGALAWHFSEYFAPEVCSDENARTELSEKLYKQMMLLSLHGQNKDALAKTKAGAWEYDILFPGYKCNMTDLQAAIGLAQFKRYPELLAKRARFIALYEELFTGTRVHIMPHHSDTATSTGHLMITRIEGISLGERNELINQMGQAGIATNVHYKPLPLLTAYKEKGFNIAEYPQAFALYENEITLPLHTLMTEEDIRFVAQTLLDLIAALQ